MQQQESNRPGSGLPYRSYGGIRRLQYVVCIIGVGILNMLMVGVAQKYPGAGLLGAALGIALTFVIVTNRLRNTGISGWWSLLILVPIANLFIGVRCLICPEGYQDTKKLDAAGRIIAGVLIGLVGLIILAAIIAGLAS